MNCTDARELIVEALSGTTPPDLRRAVEAHLASCAACRAEARAVEETAGWLRRAPDPHLRGEHWEAFMEGLEARLAADERRLWPRARRWLRQPRHAWTAAGAAAALAAALGFALLAPGGPDGRPAAEIAPDPRAQVIRLLSPQVVEGMPAMDASLAVWRAGLGAGEVSSELNGGK